MCDYGNVFDYVKSTIDSWIDLSKSDPDSDAYARLKCLAGVISFLEGGE